MILLFIYGGVQCNTYDVQIIQLVMPWQVNLTSLYSVTDLYLNPVKACKEPRDLTVLFQKLPCAYPSMEI